MSLSYAHLLVPTDPHLVPGPERIVEFLEGARPWIPAEPSAPTVDEVRRLATSASFEVRVEGVGVPRRRVVAVGTPDRDFRPDDEPYYLEVACCVRPAPVSMSDLHEGEAPPFDEPCDEGDAALYSDHATLETIRVPGIACARFFVRVDYGKWLFPRLEGSLEIADPEFVALAERVFGARFKQGCYWG